VARRRCATVDCARPRGVWIAVKRAPDGGAAVDEQYAVYDRLLIGSHKL
jgi:hypothetical protein